MTERSTFDAFEQRIADELAQYVASARDPKPATEIAALAMRPRGFVGRARSLSRARRFLVLGLAAALLLPAAYIGALNLRPPAPDQVIEVQPSRTDGPRPTAPPDVPPSTAEPGPVANSDLAIFLRRDEGTDPGLSVFVVRPDGSEALLGTLLDSIVAGHGKLSEAGTVSESGWLALTVDQFDGPGPLVLVDLVDEAARPWVIDEANLGGTPSWGPTGVLAAYAGPSAELIADPESRTTRMVSGLSADAEAIWTADGSGIVSTKSTKSDLTYEIAPIDGGAHRPDIGEIFDPNGWYGPTLAGLNICSPEMGCRWGEDATCSFGSFACPVTDDGRIVRVERDRSGRTIWRQTADRALSVRFGRGPDEYWLVLDHDQGRQFELVHLQDGHQDAVATVNRRAAWLTVRGPTVAPDGSSTIVWIDLGTKLAAVVVPPDGTPPTFHSGQFAGFVGSAASGVFTRAQYRPPAEPMPIRGEAFHLRSLDELIAAHPGRVALGKASREGVDGETEVRTFEVPLDPGAGEAYLDCQGPSGVTISSGTGYGASDCLRGVEPYFLPVTGGSIVVTTTGDTSWRVVVFSY